MGPLPLPPCGQIDTYECKHYLPTTSLTGGKYRIQWKLWIQHFFVQNHTFFSNPFQYSVVRIQVFMFCRIFSFFANDVNPRCFWISTSLTSSQHRYWPARIPIGSTYQHFNIGLVGAPLAIFEVTLSTFYSRDIHVKLTFLLQFNWLQHRLYNNI